MRKLEILIRKFIYQIDKNIRVVFHDDEMESASLEKTVFMNVDEFIYKFDNEDLHIRIMKEKGMLIDILLPTFILLHEIGHCKTINRYVSPLGKLRQFETKRDNLIKNLNGYELLKTYKYLDLEKDADEYAYNFYLHNYTFVKKFDKEIRAML
jgi:hypothetical protein